MRSHFGRGAAAVAAVCLAFAAAYAADDTKTGKAKTERKAPSVCVGLDVTACGAKTECYWKQKITTKAGKTRRAHCRLKPKQQVANKAT